MRIAKVIGNVTLSRVHPTLEGHRWLMALPYSLPGLAKDEAGGEEIILLDQLGAGMGQKIAVSEGVEASMPFFPDKRAIDAYCAAILDTVTITGRTDF